MSALAAAVNRAMCNSLQVKDLYTGDCRGCGQCCSRFLPMTVADEVRLRAYVEGNGIEIRTPDPDVLDLTCPLLVDGECAAYEARPEICRAYRCDRHLRGTMPTPKGIDLGMRVVDVCDVLGVDWR